MKMSIKLSLLSLVTASILSADTLDTKQIIVTKESVTGQKIVENIQQYNEYMDNQAKFAAKAPEQADQNSCDVNKLKLAVVKLIQRLDTLENANNGIADLKNQITSLQSQIDSLKPLPKLEVQQSPETAKQICTTKKVLVSSDGKNGFEPESSFLNFKNDTYFTATTSLDESKYPSVEAEISENKVKAGTKFKADKFTKAGWVHIENGEWVKGYSLSPKFMPSSKIMNTKPVHKIFAKKIYKDVVTCAPKE
jgi:hypothetical protein